MDETFKCKECGNDFVGDYNGSNFPLYCGEVCREAVDARQTAWMYSGQWLKDLSAVTAGIAAQQGQGLNYGTWYPVGQTPDALIKVNPDNTVEVIQGDEAEQSTPIVEVE